MRRAAGAGRRALARSSPRIARRWSGTSRRQDRTRGASRRWTGRATAAELASVLPEVKPDHAVWNAIAARIGAGRPRSRARVGPVGWAAVAAAAVALAFLQLERMESVDIGTRRARRAPWPTRPRRSATELPGRAERAGGRRGAGDALALLDRPGTRLVPLARSLARPGAPSPS